jgi:hypothetical protein
MVGVLGSQHCVRMDGSGGRLTRERSSNALWRRDAVCSSYRHGALGVQGHGWAGSVSRRSDHATAATSV